MNKTKNRFWAVVRFFWNHPVILVPILLIPAYFLFNGIRSQAFTSYFRCNYVLGDGINFHSIIGDRTWTSVFCEGFTIDLLVAKVEVPGLAWLLDPLLEFVRTVSVWAILLFFAFISLLLTQILNNVKAIVKIVTFNREEWKRLGASIFTFLLIYVVFCTLFYFNVVHPLF